MVTELYSYLPLVVATALLVFSIVAGRKALKQQGMQPSKWNEYVR